jgi:hypothetical protein
MLRTALKPWSIPIKFPGICSGCANDLSFAKSAAESGVFASWQQ